MKIREDLERLKQVFEPVAAEAREGSRKPEIARSGTWRLLRSISFGDPQ